MTPSIAPTLLIVDDDRITRQILAELFRHDCRILLARDGATALQILAAEDVHLVLLDVSMLGMSGHEVLLRMKDSERSADIPVIFITSLAEEVDEERGLLMGAADYVQKPIRPAIVRARVLTHLKLGLQRRALSNLAAHDGLTGVANRRSFDLALDRAMRMARRSGSPLALGLFDVDHFKQFNDHYGHGAGDAVLRRVAEVLAGMARRAEDIVARYGGEEFAILLPACTDLEQIMETARRSIEHAAIPHATSPTAGFLTVSGGGIVQTRHQETTTKFLLEQADALLYRAKADGRNRVLVSQ